MSESLCPVHHVPLALGERVDPRRDVNPREWSCPVGGKHGHWMSLWTVEHADDVTCRSHGVPMRLEERDADRLTLVASQIDWHCPKNNRREVTTGHWTTQPEVEKQNTAA